MIKKTAVLLLILSAAGFAFDWGVFVGPGPMVTFTNMNPVETSIASSNIEDYDVPSIANYQFGLQTPITIRLFDFTIGWGDTYGWQTSSGSEWKASFKHRLQFTEFGYIIDLGEHLRLRPVIGLGDYDIDMNLSELGGGFGDPEEGELESYSYDYDNYSMTAGASLSYLWKFSNRVVVGLEAKARYLIPFQKDVRWDANGDYDDGRVPDFYPHTPVIGVNFVIGYENVSDDDWVEDDWEEDWPEE
jgi:hypothetical protein